MPTISDASCILVIGATAGIGRALALAIHDLPSKPLVIVAGRRQERLDELCNYDERIRQARVDMLNDQEALEKFAADIIVEYPQLDAVMYSSGILHLVDFANPDAVYLDRFKNEFTTNYISVITLIRSFMPHFLKLSGANKPSFIIPITSALAIFPNAKMPTYCATKAALHSMALALDAQLKDTNVHVMEILPPLVESELHDGACTKEMYKDLWMPLDEFTRLTMVGLLRGDLQNVVGSALTRWNTYEQGKSEAIHAVLAGKRP